ncbi:proteinase inhibitor I4 serpin [Nostoc sp. 'Peltigera membranacea cyanobiont' 213]|uniref:serpin family protein n=1 Tax=Nostoc sp. 'Peltigera membranacea cyanobiont' 213 TaxID=2014530 RepID=UPI000B95A101|nr:serpin family protein [Nostoc sp. 'Peltigera membranacea cyanobiont' 213]OYD98247.1 proteinase inhibitor I4 serpin [Nostoc sp. 'Peltigera membranacea cyanobiont' 213]
MNRQKFSDAKENFLQRRYGVSLGRRYALAAASVVLFSVLGCSQVESNKSALAQSSLPQPETPLQKKTVNPDTRIVESSNKFGFKLFSEVLKDDKGENNIFISPSSIAIALAMTYNGASGSTQQAMAKTLELQGMNLPEINSAYAAALKQLLDNQDAKVQLSIANSLWANQDVSFAPDFLKRTQDFYQAKVSNLNFKDAAASSIINNWVKENTKGKITKIVEKIEPSQVLFLINAIYFKGNWSNEFDKSKTAQYPFYITPSRRKQHLMMSQEGDYRYYENEQFQAVSLPYGKDGKTSFYIFLPKQNSNLKALYQNLSFENWEKWMTQFNKQKGFIRLPRFKTDYEVTLNDALKSLGMEEAFSNKANFSGMGKNFAISQVKHKTFVEVNEEGTEAAAATSVGIVATSLREEPEPFRMIVDRPFFCAIRNNQTGNILFMGSIIEPQ